MSIRHFLHRTWSIIRAAIHHLTANDLFRMAGATAFFTTFALPAILIIIVQTIGLFTDRQKLGQYMGSQLRLILGADSMDSVVKAIRSFRALQHNYLLSAIIFLFLIFVATTLFKIIRNSINEIWSIRRMPAQRFSAMLRSRAVSVGVILLGGILFLGVQLIDAGQQIFGSYLVNNLPHTTFYLGAALHRLLALGVSTLWFYALFRFTPDGQPPQKIALGGGCITALLFGVGKVVLGQLLSPGRVAHFYGASGALVLILLFVFYSSIILYFGAAIIRAWGDAAATPIVPKAHAARYRIEAVPE